VVNGLTITAASYACPSAAVDSAAIARIRRALSSAGLLPGRVRAVCSPWVIWTSICSAVPAARAVRGALPAAAGRPGTPLQVPAR